MKATHGIYHTRNLLWDYYHPARVVRSPSRVCGSASFAGSSKGNMRVEDRHANEEMYLYLGSREERRPVSTFYILEGVLFFLNGLVLCRGNGTFDNGEELLGHPRSDGHRQIGIEHARPNRY